jgi:diadenosine tetraphosphate (Ap4A) HIT family hydrolase
MTTLSDSCPFCGIEDDRKLFSTSQVMGVWDAFPVSHGHVLLIPRRHIATWFDATIEEQQALVAAIDEAKTAIELEHKPDGYNIGINSGEAAGQTVQHLHVHVIPRYEGDVNDPRGGVRQVLPEKAVYWET